MERHKLERLINYCRPSQEHLKAILESELLRQRGNERVENQDGFLYSPGTHPVLLVAHLDTVHQQLPAIFYIDNSRSPDGDLWCAEGIGGDDRCGVFIIMELIKELDCHVLFTEDEERGGRGAIEFCESEIIPDVQFIVEFDRQGRDDAVFYNCDNPDFTDFVERYGFRENTGTFSDISFIAPDLGIALPVAPPITDAIINKQWEAVKFLLERGANVNADGESGWKPIHYAAVKGNMEIMTLLLDHGAKVNARNKNEAEPLHIAAMNGKVEVMATLLGKGADIESQDRWYQTPLVYGVREKQLAAARFLIERGANVSTIDENGISPLPYAVIDNEIEMMKLLLDNGADVESVDNNADTPAIYAVASGNAEAVKLLVERGADVNRKYTSGKTLLHFAVIESQPAIIPILVELGAVVSTQDDDERTPLCYAVADKNSEALAALVKAGADLDSMVSRWKKSIALRKENRQLIDI